MDGDENNFDNLQSFLELNRTLALPRVTYIEKTLKKVESNYLLQRIRSEGLSISQNFSTPRSSNTRQRRSNLPSSDLNESTFSSGSLFMKTDVSNFK